MAGGLRKLMGVASVVEVATGLALMLAPAVVVSLLLGTTPAGDGMALARFLGIALLALGVACWPSRAAEGAGAPAVRGLLLYNVLVAAFLTALAALEHRGGILLWPAAVLHALVAIGLLWQMRRAG